jgi:hypothetical protein
LHIYKAIFFDWDGTAVVSRKSPADAAADAMAPLLSAGIKLCVISGTSLKNIGGGLFWERFAPETRRNLYFGLDRGVNNYSFDSAGNLIHLPGFLPDRVKLSALHKVCFALHMILFEGYGFNTDIVFCRDGYCKIDLSPEADRGGQLFFRDGEIERANALLSEKGYNYGLRGLIQLAEKLGAENGLAIKATTDAKFLEAGFGTKSDNVDTILKQIGLSAEGCCFWGDEFLKMGEGIFGSDSYFITEATKTADFFDVSEAAGERPACVKQLGGGVERFLSFLREQSRML